VIDRSESRSARELTTQLLWSPGSCWEGCAVARRAAKSRHRDLGLEY
jgi:hypothetical protein